MCSTYKWNVSSIVSDSSYFTSNNVLDNMYSTVNLIAQEEATTVVDCAHKCTSLSSCQSLFYLSSIQSCLLNSAIYNTGNIGHIGAVYFEKCKFTYCYSSYRQQWLFNGLGSRGLWLWCLTPLSLIFQLYRGGTNVEKWMS